jgi:hypothetical protein
MDILNPNERAGVFDAASHLNIHGWTVVSDRVMGGLSGGKVVVNSDRLIFSGEVSLKNNGGFTMLKKQFSRITLPGHNAFVVKLKGDKRPYQFRVKSNKDQDHSHTYRFDTNGEWQEIVIPYALLTPKFRGRKLDLPGFEGKYLEEVGFLIGNKREENFELQISYIGTALKNVH